MYKHFIKVLINNFCLPITINFFLGSKSLPIDSNNGLVPRLRRQIVNIYLDN